MRRAVFAYDTTYPQEALSVIPVEFYTQKAVPRLVYEQVIPDTGAEPVRCRGRIGPGWLWSPTRTSQG